MLRQILHKRRVRKSLSGWEFRICWGGKLAVRPPSPPAALWAGPAEPSFCSILHRPAGKRFGDAQPKRVPPCFHNVAPSFTSVCDSAGSSARVPTFSPFSHTAAWLNILHVHPPSSTPRCLLQLCRSSLPGAARPRGHLELVPLSGGYCRPMAPRGPSPLLPRPWHSTLGDLLCSVSVQGLMREEKEKAQLICLTIKLLNSFLSITLLQALSDRWGQIEWFDGVR